LQGAQEALKAAKSGPLEARPTLEQLSKVENAAIEIAVASLKNTLSNTANSL
jgi:hypothetical protein